MLFLQKKHFADTVHYKSTSNWHQLTVLLDLLFLASTHNLVAFLTF